MIFVDTVAWLYLFDQNQSGVECQQAREFLDSVAEALCTSDLVIAETYKWLLHHNRPSLTAERVLSKLVMQEIAVILPIEQQDRGEALTIARKYSDQKLSYEDAVTVALTRRFGVRKVFSFDRHFLMFPEIERVP